MTNQIVQARDFHSALTEFESAWENPNHTRFELPPVYVNQVLRQRYQVDERVVLTRDQLWDMELKKAWDPKTYIPYVVSEGRSWDRQGMGGRTEQHAASGYTDDPSNLWRIVVLTDGRDDRFTEPFKEMVRAGWLPGFVEIYIEQRFNCKLIRQN
jgi:hypothetical protein